MFKSSLLARCCSRPDMMLQILFLVALLGSCIGYDLFDDDKRQDLVPFPRVGRGYWAWVEDKRQGLVPFPRVGRSEEKRQGLIPFPRIGRSMQDWDVTDFDTNWDDDFGIAVFKRGPLAFTPRIGRKKRSIESDDEAQQDNREISKAYNQNAWQYPALDDIDVDFDDGYLFRPARQMIPAPRVGRASLIPRLGKKRSESEPEYMDDGSNKRAAAFTPRIGRAPLIPRIGRSDPAIALSSRAAFTPRIGRAALIPRIGRSDKGESATDSKKSS